MYVVGCKGTSFMTMHINRRHLALWISSVTASSQSSFTTSAESTINTTSDGGRTLAAAFVRKGRRAVSSSTDITIPSRSLAISHRSMSTTSSDTPLSSSTKVRRVALCQFPVSHDKTVNHETAARYVRTAAQQGAQLVVLPEIWNGPYATAAFGEYAEELPVVGTKYGSFTTTSSDASSSSSPSARLLQELARDCNVWLVGGSISEREGDKLYNTCLVMDPTGTIVAKHRKAHLFDIDVPGGITFRESDTLSAGNGLSHFDTTDDLFGMVGLGICYDIRFPEYALLLNQQYKCNLLIYPGAFNLTTGPAHWELLQRARAVDNQCFVLAASPARTPEPETPGKYPHYTAWGHSTVVAPWGDIVATCDEKEALVVADIDLAKVVEMRQGIPTGLQKRTDLYTLQAAAREQ